MRDATIDEKIVNRKYQFEAVRNVCEAFEDENRRKALLVMATGSGKTRTAAAICDVLQRRHWARNVLFLADRNALVTQAKRAFGDYLENMNGVNLVEDKENSDARYVFSTYPTMASCIDETADADGRLFTPGHFDLVICDEAHRSIYNKYRAIFEYFDAPLLGMTATPKDEIDRNTYDTFDLDDGSPTFAYDLSDAVEDGYLVDYKSVETKLKIIEEGIVYDDLSDEEKERYEETFADEDGNFPKVIEPGEINERFFNKDTIARVLAILMDMGLKVDSGLKLGKTIIFAKNHPHAEKILEIFQKQYPKLVGYAKVIDNHINYAQTLIDEFSDKDKPPQIAISVDMLDTGIDVPEVLNLVFFKKVRSKAKFWQMIGRGTRLCADLIDGLRDKEFFYIFDFCDNFEFFRVNKNGSKGQSAIPLQGRLFLIKAEIAMKLQKAEYQTPELIALRKSIVDELVGKVKSLNRDNFAVRRALRTVENYSSDKAFETLTNDDLRTIKDDLARLVEPEQNADPKALNFDGLIYAIETAALEGKKNHGALKRDFNTARSLTEHANLPQINAKTDLLGKIVGSDYLLESGIDDFEHIRKELRDLIKFLPSKQARLDVNFTDEVLSSEIKNSELVGQSLEGYKQKTEKYLREHKQSNSVVAKLYENISLSRDDVVELERLLWSELGSKEDYQKEYGDKDLGALVREVVGLDQRAAQEAFSKFLNDATLNSRQIYFIDAIVRHIVKNGMLDDLSILQETPFTDQGSVFDLFGDNLDVFGGIRDAIQQINRNALGA
ncbi:MAG: DEAD/DEAH box helicase family protein [Thermoguttaceae bacterium]|nr:DEAD/DEAH box helicase family protein [Thermoguttaceae bacterium]